MAVIRSRITTPEPTAALPGTPEKLEVLAARYAAGLDLFHAEDAHYDVAADVDQYPSRTPTTASDSRDGDRRQLHDHDSGSRGRSSMLG
jgi:hypothetical protein